MWISSRNVNIIHHPTPPHPTPPPKTQNRQFGTRPSARRVPTTNLHWFFIAGISNERWINSEIRPNGSHGCRFGGLRLGWLGLGLAIQWSGGAKRKQKVGGCGWLVWLVGWLVGCSGYSRIAMHHLSSSSPPSENLDPFFLEGWDC